MCGIAGIFSFDDPLPAGAIERMVGALHHRGPDDGGFIEDGPVALGMRRLSIIGVANGRQPIWNEDESVALVLNGEIYNYQEVKRELLQQGHVFSTDSDAEVAVHLYEERGDSFVESLRGMFALALYDRRQKRLVLARDRAGKKPLYFSQQGGQLAFASEIKAIHESGLVKKELRRSSLPSFLAHGYVVGDATLFEHVLKLPPGAALVVADGAAVVRPYWKLPAPGRHDIGLEEATEQLEALFEEAVRIRLMSEVPLGAFLSGGIDSSAVVAVMTRLLGKSSEPLQTFTVGFRDSRLDELRYARQVAEQFGTAHHEVEVAGCDLDLLARVNWHHDDAAGDPAAIPTYLLSKFARQRVTVALTGEGGDELFAGYRHYGSALRLQQIESRLAFLSGAGRSAMAAIARLNGMLPDRLGKAAWILGRAPEARHAAWQSAFTDQELLRLLRPDVFSQRPPVPDYGNPLEDMSNVEPLHQLLGIESRSPLPDNLLMKVDKMTMATSLEARCPLLDQEVVDFAWSLPLDLKISRDGGKRVLRRALARFLPAEILGRPKQGFDVPMRRWLVEDLSSAVEQLVLSPTAPLGQFVRKEALADIASATRRGSSSRKALQLWRLLNLAVWLELHWPESRTLPLSSRELAAESLEACA